MPRSPSFITSSAPKNMFWGLRSRCRILHGMGWQHVCVSNQYIHNPRQMHEAFVRIHENFRSPQQFAAKHSHMELVYHTYRCLSKHTHTNRHSSWMKSSAMSSCTTQRMTRSSAKGVGVGLFCFLKKAHTP